MPPLSAAGENQRAPIFVWDGTNEIQAQTITVWDGSVERPMVAVEVIP